MKLPPAKVPHFSGGPIKYCAFIHAFETIIETKEQDQECACTITCSTPAVWLMIWYVAVCISKILVMLFLGPNHY